MLLTYRNDQNNHRRRHPRRPAFDRNERIESVRQEASIRVILRDLVPSPPDPISSAT